MDSFADTFVDSYLLILNEIRCALDAVDPAQVEQFLKALVGAEKVFVIGVGRVMLSLQAFAKRLNHLGIPTYCVGDINEPAITERDLLLVGSGSGESVVPVAIAQRAHHFGAKIVHLGSNPYSSLAPLTDIFVRIPVKTKLCLPDEIRSDQIMSSLFEQALYVLGDAVTLSFARRHNLDLTGLWQYHANLE
jgi:6-phospho-3-hexuloisomerase